jgi:quercetin dioxygenase-like cupin family protein
MSDESGPTTPDRLRTHPGQRFLAGHRKIDLEQATAGLRAEGRVGGGGHRQTTLYKHGGATVALFLFDAGGRLAEHHTAGTVTIHALDGRLRVAAGGETHELTAGQLVALAPGVPHDVAAAEPSRMLLTVHLEPARPAEPH